MNYLVCVLKCAACTQPWFSEEALKKNKYIALEEEAVLFALGLTVDPWQWKIEPHL